MRSAFLTFALALVAIPACFAASPDKTPSAEGDAQLLDQNSYPCSNCLFGTSDTFYCLKVNNKVLVAHEHVLQMNYRDSNRNYFTKARKNMVPWAPASGATVHVKYNDKYLWVPGPAGKKDIRMEQKYTTDIFMNSQACRDVVHAPGL